MAVKVVAVQVVKEIVNIVVEAAALPIAEAVAKVDVLGVAHTL